MFIARPPVKGGPTWCSPLLKSGDTCTSGNFSGVQDFLVYHAGADPGFGDKQALEQVHGEPVGHAGQEVLRRHIHPLGRDGADVKELLGALLDFLP